VLIDAASVYVLGHVLSRVVDESPHEKGVEAFFRKAWEAEKLIVPENSIAENVFRKQAKKMASPLKLFHYLIWSQL
jgi:hypothetical protein